MSMDVTSTSMMGAALGVRQGQNQADFGVNALSQSMQPEQAVAALLGGQANPATMNSPGVASGGNVTPTRGQNLNIVV